MKLNLWERDKTCPEEKWRFKVPSQARLPGIALALQDINSEVILYQHSI